MDDDDLDLVESEDDDSEDYMNYQNTNHYKENRNFNPLNPLSRNIANLPIATGIEQRSPGSLC